MFTFADDSKQIFPRNNTSKKRNPLPEYVLTCELKCEYIKQLNECVFKLSVMDYLHSNVMSPWELVLVMDESMSSRFQGTVGKELR